MSTIKVNSSRNSRCGSARLNQLDWYNWFTDTSFDSHYLHVRRIPDGRRPDDETWHRVFCKLSDRPRLRLKDGELYWVTPDPPASPISK